MRVTEKMGWSYAVSNAHATCRGMPGTLCGSTAMTYAY